MGYSGPLHLALLQPVLRGYNSTLHTGHVKMVATIILQFSLISIPLILQSSFSRSPLATLDFPIFSLRDHLLLWAITLIMCCTLYSDDSRSATWQVLDCPIFILFLALYYGNWAMSKLPAGLAQLRSPSLALIQPGQHECR